MLVAGLDRVLCVLCVVLYLKLLHSEAWASILHLMVVHLAFFHSDMWSCV